MQVAPNGRVFFINHLDKKVGGWSYIIGLVFDIAHFRPPGLILETVVPPPFLVRAMFPTGSPIFLHISTNCRNNFLQTAPGWPRSLARGLGGAGSHRRKDIFHWSQHKVISYKLSVIGLNLSGLGSWCLYSDIVHIENDHRLTQWEDPRISNPQIAGQVHDTLKI